MARRLQKEKCVLPVRSRRTLEADGEMTVAHTVHCPVTGTSVPLERCAECPRLEAVDAEGEGHILILCSPSGWSAIERGGVGDATLGGEAQITPISAIMRKTVVCARPETSVVALVELFLDGAVKAVPVVNALGQPIGVVSKTDVLRSARDAADTEEQTARAPTVDRERDIRDDHDEALDEGFHLTQFPSATAVDVMTPIVLWLEETAPLSRAAALMTIRSLHQILVVSPGTRNVVGILTSADVVRWVAAISGERLPAPS
jgi:CBS domain-containing protein